MKLTGIRLAGYDDGIWIEIPRAKIKAMIQGHWSSEWLVVETPYFLIGTDRETFFPGSPIEINLNLIGAFLGEVEVEPHRKLPAESRYLQTVKS